MDFKITEGKGFTMTFENRWTISVQFGYGNYSDNYSLPKEADEDFSAHQQRAGRLGSNTAEVAILTPQGEFFQHATFEADTVRGWVSSDEVGRLIAWTMARD